MNKKKSIQKHHGGTRTEPCNKREGNRHHTQQLDGEYVLERVCPRTGKCTQAVVSNFQVKLSILPKVIDKCNSVITRVTHHFTKITTKSSGRNKRALNRQE